MFYEVLCGGLLGREWRRLRGLHRSDREARPPAVVGIDCLWLPPFDQSPLRDGGYDISDYYSVLQ
ncbi:alpha-amylase family glycosyl hydrolase [Kocuria rhizophila]|nr:alpha-amylase family glycosyl hydrolase [Kocuria rhizophila]